jgi:hypothetical protein
MTTSRTHGAVAVSVVLTLISGTYLGACVKTNAIDTPRAAAVSGATKRPPNRGTKYLIKFHRPRTVGLRFRVISSGRIDSSSAVDGRLDASRSIEMTYTYEAVITVKAVHACGIATRVEARIGKLQVTRHGTTKNLLPKNAVVIGQTAGTDEIFTVNGKRVAKPAAEVLGFVTSLFRGSTTTSDDIFSPGGPKKPGDSWKPDPEKMLVNIMHKMKKPALTPAPSDVTGKVTLVAAKKVNGIEVVEIEANIRVDHVAPDFGQVKITAGNIEFAVSGWVPQDPKDLLNDFYSVTQKLHFEGDVARGGTTSKFVFDYDHSVKKRTIPIQK